MDIEEVRELFKQLFNSQEGNQEGVKNQLPTIEEDIEDFKSILEAYIDNYESLFEDRIKSEQILRIVNRVLNQHELVKVIKNIKSLSLSVKRQLFEYLSDVDSDLNMELFNENFKNIKKSISGRLSESEKLDTIKYFHFLETSLKFSQEQEKRSLEESIHLLETHFSSHDKIKKLYKNISSGKAFFISKELEETVLNDMNLTNDGQDVAKRVIEYNNQKYVQLEEENARQKQQRELERQREIAELKAKREAQLKQQRVKEPEPIEVLDLDDDFIGVDVVDPIFENNVQNYTNAILEHSDLNTVETIFPPRNIKKYYKLMTKIMSNIREIIEMQLKELEHTDNDYMIKYINDIIDNETEKLNQLLTYYHGQTVDEYHSEEKNEAQLFFATNNGKVLLFDDLKDRKYEDRRNCMDTLTLLYKLQAEDFGNSSIKGRKIQNNGALEDIFEIKLYQSRLFFKRLSGNNYYVIKAMIKKDDNSMYDRKQISHRASLTDYEYRKLKENIEYNNISKEFLKTQEDILESAKDMLLPKSSKQL